MIAGLKIGIGLGIRVIKEIASLFNQLLSSTGEVLKDSDGKNLGGA